MASTAAQEAWLCIVRLFTSQDNTRRFLDVATELDLTPSTLRFLLVLSTGEDRPMRALAEDWHCDPSWVTSIVDQLEERGFAERHVDASDRRAKRIGLTSRGEEARDRALILLSEPPPAIASLSPGDQRALRDLLRKAVGGGAGGDGCGATDG
ncbi:MAG: MarR family winged helix-turn-helix transcriptional regulator [Actinobacteria bacterium]|nr:MarR family winged helix-turn-helix transcriptional regulator [Actinomycetota bacterium]